eukprot:CAMPEP_0195126760 /NCGR_PEP_ID=MMETSP0448-20130528/135630_1 /TAXON_ID=66468 /ORGANISM="Heterocapsa triquestra, Strain CCMP 448" /LENGTH=55 /DNA_ID=CAMNT_0040164455 /DNA_START=22 /DNA_END=186 /DNA_ORIENTATION=-
MANRPLASLTRLLPAGLRLFDCCRGPRRALTDMETSKTQGATRRQSPSLSSSPAR